MSAQNKGLASLSRPASRLGGRSGFTLVELLVVVSIITVLSVIGLVSFQGVRGKALDSKKKADINAIQKAYEKNFDPTLLGGQGGYKAIQDTDFASGRIPTPDGTTSTSYNFVYQPDINTPKGAFKVCTPLNNSSTSCSSPATNCYCATSTQGDSTIIQQLNTLNHPPSCDPNGTLSTGLVGYWKFDEASGTTIFDSSGLGHTGIRGNPSWDIGGKSGNAGSFNGTDSVAVTLTNALKPTTNLTVLAWAKPSNVSGCESVISAPYPNGEYQIFSACGGMFVQVNEVPGGPRVSVASSYVPANVWSFLTLTYDGVTVKAYVNGVLRNSAPYTGSITYNNSILNIGSRGGGYYYNGLIDDVRVYNRALSSSEVNSLYNSNNGCIP